MSMKKILALAPMTACLLCVVEAAAQSAPSKKPPALKDRPLNEMIEFIAPAAEDSRPASDYVDNYANDLGDGFFFAPGVIVNRHDVHEPRIVVRGFALGNRQERSTVPIYRDGAPITDVHGATHTQEIDLLATARIDILRGGGGDLRLAGDNLGGAINLISPTGRTAPGSTLRIDAGSSIDGTPGGLAHGDIAGVAGGLDYYASFTGLYETGFRDNNQRYHGLFNANIGFQPLRGVKTRFFFEAGYSDMEVAGGLTPADAAADPSLAAQPIGLGPLFPGGPLIVLTDGAEEDEFARNIFSGRIANLTEFRLFSHDVDARLHFARRDIDSPQIDFIGVLDEAGHEWGANLAVSREARLFGLNTRYRIGGSYTTGAQTSDRFENLNGARGDQLIDTEHRSRNITGFVEAALQPFRRLHAELGGKFIRVDRDLFVDDDETPEEASFTGVAARGGLRYELAKRLDVFANASRTYEPPTFAELISDNPEDFNGLEEQDAFSYEAGLRGARGDWLRWDVAYYNTDVENEIVNIDDPEVNGVGTLVNVDATTHKGVELGLDVNLIPALTKRSGAALTWRSAYNYNNFTITDGGGIGVSTGNRLAGAPQHLYRGELRYDADGRWFAAANVEYAGGAFFGDHENEFSVPSYTVVGFSAGKRLNDNTEIFVSGENLTDEAYPIGITPVREQDLQNGRIFTPANGASVYAGLRMRF